MWLDLPLLAKREHNHDSTIYAFGLPEGKSLELPVCACLLLKAPGRGRKEGERADTCIEGGAWGCTCPPPY